MYSLPVYANRSDRSGPFEELIGRAEIRDDKIVIEIPSEKIVGVTGEALLLNQLRGFHVSVTYMPAKEV